MVSFVDGMTTDEPTLRDEMYENAALHDKDGTWQMIFGVNTLPAYRCRGCAGAVLERVIADARAQGRRGCVLTCKDKLVHYYEKFGFVNEGVSQRRMSDEELVKTAVREGFDINEYLRRG